MSVTEVVARIQQLQALMGAGRPVPAQPRGDFAATLAGVSGTAATATAAGAPVPSVPGPTGGVSGVPYADQINAAAARHRIDPALLAGLIRQESNFDPSAVSAAGARGLTQLMPGTAAGLGVTDPADPAQAIEGGARYLRQQLDRFGNDPARALAAYNAGPGAVIRHGGVPPYAETQAYVSKVQAYADEYRRSGVAAAAPVPAASVTPSILPLASSQAGGLGYSTT